MFYFFKKIKLYKQNLLDVLNLPPFRRIISKTSSIESEAGPGT